MSITVITSRLEMMLGNLRISATVLSSRYLVSSYPRIIEHRYLTQ